MSDVKWIKITTDMFEDEKIDFISSLPEADAILVIWIRLLTLAGKCNAGGYIYLTERIPYTEDMLAHKFKKPPNIIKLALDTFRRLEMLDIDENGIFLPNWEKHQNIEGLEKIREQTRQRVRDHRERKMLRYCNVTVTKDVTLGNATDIDIDIDIDKENIIILQPDEAVFISTLEMVKGYPVDRKKDLEMYKTLQERYPTLDIVESLKDWYIYKQDRPLRPKDNPRSQINTWMKKAVEYGKNLKEVNREPKRNIRM